MSDILDDLIRFAQETVKWRNPGFRNDSHVAPAGMDVFVDVMEHYSDNPTSYLPSDMTEDQKKMFELFFGSIPGYKDLLELRDTYKYWRDYLKNTGMDWSDLLYPTRMSGFGAGSDVLNYVSSNVTRLYRTAESDARERARRERELQRELYYYHKRR